MLIKVKIKRGAFEFTPAKINIAEITPNTAHSKPVITFSMDFHESIFSTLIDFPINNATTSASIAWNAAS